LLTVFLVITVLVDTGNGTKAKPFHLTDNMAPIIQTWDAVSFQPPILIYVSPHEKTRLVEFYVIMKKTTSKEM
jgi:hypothetical protein